MKKVTGIILCAVIIIVSVISLMSCGAKSDAEKIVGKWTGTVDLSEMMKQELNDSSSELFSLDTSALDGLTLEFIYEFTKEGTYTLSVDDASFDAFFQKIKVWAKSAFETMFKSSAEENGVDLTTLLTMMGVSSIDEFVEQTYSDETKASLRKQMADDENAKGKYKVDGGKLFMSKSGEEFKDSEYIKYEFVNNSQLKLTEAVGISDENTAISINVLPITLIKK